MTTRDKHMLEVFQGLGEHESAEHPPGPPSPPPEEPPRPRPRPPAGGAGRPSGVLVGAIAFAFLVGLLVGRITAPAGEVSAGAGSEATDDPLAFLDRPTARRAEPERPAPRSSAEEDAFAAMRSALLDKSNKYTVLAITYDLNETNRALAVATARHFVARGLDVCEPYERGDLLYIMVGASPSSRALNGLVEDVRSQLDPAGRRDQYRSAYVERIDTIVSGRN